MSILSTIESEIVARVGTIAYLQAAQGGTVRGVSDIETALNLSRIPAPAVIVEYAGEGAAPRREGPLHMGSGDDKAQQFLRAQWDLFVVAQNFGGRYDDPQTGRVDDPETGQKGAMTIIDDLFGKLGGYKLPSFSSKTFWIGAKRYSIQDSSVIYVVRIYNDFLRSN